MGFSLSKDFLGRHFKKFEIFLEWVGAKDGMPLAMAA
jgi:hypothetical protein